MKKAVGFVGRFQPFHRGHLKIIRDVMNKYPEHEFVLMIVRREKDDLSNTSPFTSKFIIGEIKKVLPDIRIILVPNANLVAIHDDLSNLFSLKLDAFICGPDRIIAYQTQSKNYALGIKVIEHSEIYNIRGTLVREALRNNDVLAFQRMMPLEVDFQDYKSEMRKVEKPNL